MVSMTESVEATKAPDRQGRAPQGAQICWVDVRAAGQATSAVLEEAAHQRIDGVLSSRVEDLAVLGQIHHLAVVVDHVAGVGANDGDLGLLGHGAS